MSTLTEDVEALHAKRAEATKKKQDADDLKAQADEMELALFERMEHERVGSFRVDGLTNAVRAETVYGQVQDKAEFVEWAEEHMPELLDLGVRKKLINELVRERLDSGEQLPPGLGFYSDQYVSLRAA